MLNNAEFYPKDLNPIHVLLYETFHPRYTGEREPLFLIDHLDSQLVTENNDELYSKLVRVTT